MIHHNISALLLFNNTDLCFYILVESSVQTNRKDVYIIELILLEYSYPPEGISDIEKNIVCYKKCRHYLIV